MRACFYQKENMFNTSRSLWPSALLNATLVVLGGDDAGLGAAWAAGQLGIDTLLVLSHPRDLGGDFTMSIPTDLALPPPSVGGINLVYDTFARRHTNQPSGRPDYSMNGRVAPPGPSFEFLRNLIANLSSVRVVSGFIARPHSGTVGSGACQHGHSWQSDPASCNGSTANRSCPHGHGASLSCCHNSALGDERCVAGLQLISENGTVVNVTTRFVIDGTPEGCVALFFGLFALACAHQRGVWACLLLLVHSLRFAFLIVVCTWCPFLLSCVWVSAFVAVKPVM